jgi:acetate kinase
MRILVVNPGSSSVKLSLLDESDRLLASETIPARAGEISDDDFEERLQRLGDADAIGLRVVHGGEIFEGPALIDKSVLAALERLVDLAPLHQPTAIKAIEIIKRLRPAIPLVGCFDTAFHRDLPAAARTYALPASWRERWPIRRFGFHGLSHAYAAQRVAKMLGRSDLSIIVCHLGSGASLAAIRGMKSLDTTMGFTPMEGLVMATRSGSVDPGLVLWLANKLSPAEVEAALDSKSGLLGLGGSSKMDEIVRRSASDRQAALAFDTYTHRLRAEIGGMAAGLGGLDVLVFTGGVGENSPEVRYATTERLSFLGVKIDRDANTRVTADCEIGTPDSEVHTVVIHSREDLEISHQVQRALSND